MSTPPSVALVTGASSGFGAAIAARLAARGLRVFGTSRSGAATTAAITMLALDVDRDDSVRACFAALHRDTDRLDLVVNNAGRAMVGACEETSADEARALFETNLLGVMRVTSAALPTMRAQRRGRVVNLGSASGFVGVPFHGVYAATKHALAGYSEALHHEVRDFGIQVSLIEPSAHRTAIQMVRPRALLAPYDHGRATVEAIIRAQIDAGPDPERVVDAVVRAATARSPRLRYRVGARSVLGAWARRLLPDRAFAAFVRREFRLATDPRSR